MRNVHPCTRHEKVGKTFTFIGLCQGCVRQFWGVSCKSLKLLLRPGCVPSLDTILPSSAKREASVRWRLQSLPAWAGCEPGYLLVKETVGPPGSGAIRATMERPLAPWGLRRWATPVLLLGLSMPWFWNREGGNGSLLSHWTGEHTGFFLSTCRNACFFGPPVLAVVSRCEWKGLGVLFRDLSLKLELLKQDCNILSFKTSVPREEHMSSWPSQS